MNTKIKQTHEMFISTVAVLATATLAADEKAKCDACKLVYGSGPNGTRGVTYFNKWSKGNETVPFVEVCAFGQESATQLAGTTIHELAHVLAGWDAGHGPLWKAACERLGLRRVKAAGTNYTNAMFRPDLREAIANVALPSEGAPVSALGGMAGLLGFLGTLKPCGAGVGTRGGKSRGKGSGSRLRLWECGCGQKVRVASTTFDATHNPCGTAFECK